MDMKEKPIYASPTAEIIVVAQERLICGASEVDGKSYIQGWNDGGTTTEDVYM